jgi:hypothetical protein
MRPQPRPFRVETKSRRRATQPENSASFTRRDDWLDLVPPDDLPERDVNEDLGVAPAHEAFREAERVFARIGSVVQAVEVGDGPLAPVAVAEPARRVLPDLLAAAREEERTSIQQPTRKRSEPSTPLRRRRRKADNRTASPTAPTVEVEPKAPLEIPSEHAAAAIALSRRKTARSKLPRGQRWKERRLPKVCWGRKLPRK